MLVLHVGPHKTATTYIQHNFAERRDALGEAGWHYPEIGAEFTQGHHELAHRPERYMTPNGDEAQAFNAFVNEAKEKKQNVVFSAEGFCRWHKVNFETFRATFAQDHLDLVYVVRDPMDIFYSYWAEEVKQGHTNSLPQRFTEHFNDPMRSRILNPLLDLNKLGSIEGVRLHVVPYEIVRARKIDIFEHMVEKVLGVEGFEAASLRARNASFPIELTEFLRAMSLIQGQGARRLGSGSALRIRFTSNTSDEERAEIVEMVKTVGRAARRQIVFPKESFIQKTLARRAVNAMKGSWTMDVSEQELFPVNEQKRYLYYDTQILMQYDKIASRVHEMIARASNDAALAGTG